MAQNRIFIANMVNEIMTATPGPRHAAGLNAVSPRKLWLTDPGDIVVLPSKVSDAFADYVSGIVGMDVRAQVGIVEIPSVGLEYLPNNIVSHVDHLTQVRSAISKAGRSFEMVPFALDRPAVTLAKALAIPIADYSEMPDGKVMDLVYELNTKSGFRRLASQLGFELPAGETVDGVVDAARAAAALGGRSGAIVKFDRSSNGYGNMVLSDVECSSAGLADLMRARLQAWSEQPTFFTVEEFIPHVSVPSVEIEITEEGVSELYLCDQRCPGHSFAGMISPRNR